MTVTLCMRNPRPGLFGGKSIIDVIFLPGQCQVLNSGIDEEVPHVLHEMWG